MACPTCGGLQNNGIKEWYLKLLKIQLANDSVVIIYAKAREISTEVISQDVTRCEYIKEELWVERMSGLHVSVLYTIGDLLC